MFFYLDIINNDMKKILLTAILLIGTMTVWSQNIIHDFNPFRTYNTSDLVFPIPTSSYIIDIIAGRVYAIPRPGSGYAYYSGTVAATVINQAIAALTNGGDIYFRNKNYTITTSIIDGGNSDIRLIFERGASFTAGDSLNAPVILITNEDRWIIDGIEVDGNSTMQRTPLLSGGVYPDGIWFSTSDNCLVTNAYIHHVRRFGANFDESSLASGIQNSLVTLCGWNGVNLGNHNTDLNLFAINNDISHCSDVGTALYGIGCKVINNTYHDMDGTTGYNGSQDRYGITIEGGGRNIIEGNKFYNLNGGIGALGGFHENIINGNYFYDWDAAQDYRGAIWLYSNNSNIITSNVFYTTRTFGNAIKLEGSSNNNISNNRFTCPVPIYMPTNSDNNLITTNWFQSNSRAIVIDNSNCNNNRIIENDFDASTDDMDDSGTGTIYGNNIWYDGTYDATIP